MREQTSTKVLWEFLLSRRELVLRKVSRVLMGMAGKTKSQLITFFRGKIVCWFTGLLEDD